LHGRTFRLIDRRQTWGEHRVYFHDDAGELARLPLQWTDVEPDEATIVVGAGRAHFRYDDLCRLADLLTRLTADRAAPPPVREC
jgi:hypothetical protein